MNILRIFLYYMHCEQFCIFKFLTNTIRSLAVSKCSVFEITRLETYHQTTVLFSLLLKFGLFKVNTLIDTF